MDPVLEKIYSIKKADIPEYAKHLMLGGGTRGGPVLVKGKGCWVEDIDGKRYIDCTSQSWALYLGYANDDINAIVTEHLKSLSHVHQGFDTLSRFALARKLAELAPKGMDRVSFTVGGGLAIEGAMKIAIKNRPGAQEFMCLYDSYHGTTLGTMGASWQSTLAGGRQMAPASYNRLTKQFIRVPNPYCYRCPLGQKPETCGMLCLTVLRSTIERGVNGPVAGLVMEPLQASGGQVIFPKAWVEGVRKICDEFGIILIYDEIQTYARIGTFFAAEYYGVAPDIIVLGKGLGAGFPIGAIIVRDTLQGFTPETEELHTFANSTVAQVAGMKLIDLLEKGVLENCRKMGQRIGDGVKGMMKEFPCIGDVRQAGMHIGVELVKDPVSRAADPELYMAVRQKGFENGIIFGMGGTAKNVLKIKPPLIVTSAEADTILEKLRSSLSAGLRSLGRTA